MTQVIGVDIAVLEQVLAVLPDAALGCDAQGRICSANDEAARLLDAHSTALVGQRLSCFLPDLAAWDGRQPFLDMVRQGVLDSEHKVGSNGASRRLWTRSRVVAGPERSQHYVVLTLRDVTSRSRNEERLRELSLTDDLTGLHNRRYLESVIDFEEERAKRYDFLLACSFIDLDRFKDINDTYGHDVGDAAINALAGTLQKGCRKVDTVVRWGGDEFVLISLVKTVSGLRTMLERLVTATSSHPVRAGEHTLFLTMSCGAAVGLPEPHLNARAVLKRADTMLRQAKVEGRNRVLLEDPPPSSVRP